MLPRLLLALFVATFTHQVVFAQAKPKQKEKEQDRLAVAIKKGQNFLKTIYDPRGNGPPRNQMEGLMGMVGLHGNGQAAISGLALLESGLPANDPSVLYIANGLRRNALTITYTYEVALIIMFLDRLGEAKDEALIQFMTLRLMSGQCIDGSWSYECPGLYLDPVELRQLSEKIVKDSKLTTVPKGGVKTPKNSKVEPKKEEPEPADNDKNEEHLDGLHPALKKYAKVIYDGGMIQANPEGRGPRGPFPGGFLPAMAAKPGSGDHSNTQFATVAMWCGRRHYIETANSFKLLEKHYRNAQAADGGWGYASTGEGSTPAMTCAGLIGIAMGFGSKNARMATPGAGAGGGRDKPAELDPVNDKVMENGLKCLGNYLAAAAGEVDNRRGRIPLNELSTNLYFMWSLERVAMIYGLQTIGKIDWYNWGSECLLDSQQPNGTWNLGNYHGSTPELDTAFALLFLNRANLAQDLSASLKGKVRDPGTSRLIGGGDLKKLLEPGSRSGSGAVARKPELEPNRNSVPEKGSTNESPKTPPVPPKTDNTKDFDATVRVLVRAVLDGDPNDRDTLIDKYQEAKGGEYTEALAQIATRSSNETQFKSRTALAARLTRMKATTLVEYMKDRDPELRRAAAWASGKKGEKSLSPELIRLIGDSENNVVQAAREGLKQLSGEDFGPAISATQAEKTRALLAWRKWWDGSKK